MGHKRFFDIYFAPYDDYHQELKKLLANYRLGIDPNINDQKLREICQSIGKLSNRLQANDDLKLTKLYHDLNAKEKNGIQIFASNINELISDIIEVDNYDIQHFDTNFKEQDQVVFANYRILILTQMLENHLKVLTTDFKKFLAQ